jgi:hypothetical protein
VDLRARSNDGWRKKPPKLIFRAYETASNKNRRNPTDPGKIYQNLGATKYTFLPDKKLTSLLETHRGSEMSSSTPGKSI